MNGEQLKARELAGGVRLCLFALLAFLLAKCIAFLLNALEAENFLASLPNWTRPFVSWAAAPFHLLGVAAMLLGAKAIFIAGDGPYTPRRARWVIIAFLAALGFWILNLLLALAPIDFDGVLRLRGAASGASLILHRAGLFFFALMMLNLSDDTGVLARGAHLRFIARIFLWFFLWMLIEVWVYVCGLLQIELDRRIGGLYAWNEVIFTCVTLLLAIYAAAVMIALNGRAQSPQELPA